MKKKILLVALVLVALASTIGVGFASWIISRPAEETKTGQFYVENVTDESLYLVVTPVGNNTVLSFYGPSQGGNDAQKWLQYEDGAENGRSFQNLGVVYRFDLYRQAHGDETADLTVESVGYKKVSDAYKLNIDFSEGTVETNTFTVSGLDNAISKAGQGDLLVGATFRTANVVTNNVVASNDIESVNATLDSTNVTWTFNIQTSADGVAYLYIDYAWGSHFGGVNPFVFYNDGHNADDTKAAIENTGGEGNLYNQTTYAADAEAVLNAIHTRVNGISFKLHVKVSASDKVVSSN